MTRTAAVTVQNNFTRGLITEATGLNFPENASTDTQNCIFTRIGDVTRRLGFDTENVAQTQNVDTTSCVMLSYLWKAPAGNGALNVVVVQIGNTLYFYKVTGAALSAGLSAATISLLTYAVSGVTNVSTLECQFAAGNGYLFVVNENCDPFFITYTSGGSPEFTATKLTLQIRDFKGFTSDTTTDQQRPTTLTATHRYNLANQGWQSSYNSASVTTLTVGNGSQTLTIGTGLPIQIGDLVRIYSTAAGGFGTLAAGTGYNTTTGNIMVGPVTAYNSGTGVLTVNVTSHNGNATLSAWAVVQEPDYIEGWNVALSNYPSNADVWQFYKNPGTTAAATDIFDPAGQINNTIVGSSLSSKGHFILNPFSEDRSTASGISGFSVVASDSERPTTVAFYEGRAWFAGVNYQGFNARLYFSQIAVTGNIGNPANYGNCYQKNDPTSSQLFNLLPDDGGVIDIVGAGFIYKLQPVLNALVVFASNGIWSISGSSGAGFRANDYLVSKISSVYNNSGTSFVDADGIPFWWNFEGIYTLGYDPNPHGPQAIRVSPISLTTIKQFFDTIPEESVNLARGSYDPEAKIIQWLFKSVPSATFNDKYVFDRVLCLNTLSGAFYVWTLDPTQVKISSIVSVVSNAGSFVTNQVTSASGVNNVTAASGANNVVVSQSSSNFVSFTFKYLSSYVSGGVTKITFSENLSTNYLDWTRYSGGTNYTSYFVTGFAIRGQAMKKWQTNYIRMWSNPAVTSVFKIQNQFDYKTLGSYSIPQTITDLSLMRPIRFKLRGHGLSSQFRVTSIDGNPFDIIGWATFETGSQWV